MYWIVQQDLWNERSQFEALAEAFERLQVQHTIVKVVPFSHELIPEPQNIPAGPIYCCGATSMSRIARKRGWNPGTFLNENFDFEVWRRHYSDELLNHDARISRFDAIEPRTEPFFLRPTDDGKAFAGTVTDWPSYAQWRDQVLALGDESPTLRGDTLVIAGSVKEILREYRFFVVDGRVVTGSLYKLGRRVTYRRDYVDADVTAYAQRMVDRWAPARAFVLDVALTPAGFKVLEINCINSAGFYDIDIMAFVGAIEAMDGY